MKTTPIEERISRSIAPQLTEAGYELVRVLLTGGGRYLTLQVMAERVDGKPMTVNDCSRINHAIAEQLEADEELKDRTTLEVSSPGIDRPLVRLKDFERFAGYAARVELAAPMAGKGQRAFQGKITRITRPEPDAEIELHTETGDVRVPMSNIARAKLIITDALLKAGADTKPGTKH